MAISDVKEYAHLTEADVEALGAEFDAIRRDIESTRGERDARYIRNVIRLQRALEIDPENSAARSAYDFLTATIGTPQESAESAGDVTEAVQESFEEPLKEPCVFVGEPVESLDIAAQPDKET